MGFRWILAAAVAGTAAGNQCMMDDAEKLECGFVGINQHGCRDRGCCWHDKRQDVSTPSCFFKKRNQPDSCFKTMINMKAPFSCAEVALMKDYFMANLNIDGKGGVAHAPDYNTPAGSYYYHWERSGALAMRTLMDISENVTAVNPILEAYSQWVIGRQADEDPNLVDVRAEPKFNLPSGGVFDGKWCRPQTDGPALRAVTLMQYAIHLLNTGAHDYVTQFLWTGSADLYNGGAIKYDLDFIVDNYDLDSCDLWEQMMSTDLFWNRMATRKAMLLGAEFAGRMGDADAVTTYLDAARVLGNSLKYSHWNGDFLQEEPKRMKDASVIVALNWGFHKDEDIWSPMDFEVASTIAHFNLAFCNEYQVNGDDTEFFTPGILYGRYPEDDFAGGNPWVLTTAALAQLMYRAALWVLEHGEPVWWTKMKWAEALNVWMLPQWPKRAFAHALAAGGDAVLMRLRKHVEGDGFHLHEQIDRNLGKQTAAKDLTWSYAEVLKAVSIRDRFVDRFRIFDLALGDEDADDLTIMLRDCSSSAGESESASGEEAYATGF